MERCLDSTSPGQCENTANQRMHVSRRAEIVKVVSRSRRPRDPYLSDRKALVRNMSTDGNPYTPSDVGNDPNATNERPAVWRSMLSASLWSIIWTFPITALLGGAFRFPVPFGTIEGGVEHVLPSLFALLFYGILMGGFLAIGFAGAIFGAIAHHVAGTTHQRRFLVRFLPAVPSFGLLFLLATLDWYIGQW